MSYPTEITEVATFAGMGTSVLLQVQTFDVNPVLMHWMQVLAWLVTITTGLITIWKYFKRRKTKKHERTGNN